jgi:hypothetical protein
MTQAQLTHLERRKIEAGVLVPMIQAFQRASGVERANEIARDVIVDLARREGARWAEQNGSGLEGIDKTTAVWSGGGSLTIEAVAKTGERLEFNVTRCQYAEYFKSLGLPELGALFHCSRDFAMVEGFSQDLTLKRTQTIMQGASHCDFRFSRKVGGV